MRTIPHEDAMLLIIDFQARLMPAIEGGDNVVACARRLYDAAKMLEIPIAFTEQNPKGLGATVEQIAPNGEMVLEKMSFDASRAPDFFKHITAQNLIVVGCEAHVCVLQTVLGLLEQKRKVFVVSDAIGSRHQDNKQAAIARMAQHGAEIVTSEMVLFEWLGDAEHPRFKDVVQLIK